MAIAQQIIRLTPGGFATKAIETLGKADTPILIAFVVVATLLIAGFLAYLSLIRSWLIGLIGVGILAAVAVVASFAEPFDAPVATVLTAVGALGLLYTPVAVHAAALLVVHAAAPRTASAEDSPATAPPSRGGADHYTTL